jgi:hypothetical protein
VSETGFARAARRLTAAKIAEVDPSGSSLRANSGQTVFRRRPDYSPQVGIAPANFRIVRYSDVTFSVRCWRGSWVAFRRRLWRSCASLWGSRPFLCRAHTVLTVSKPVGAGCSIRPSRIGRPLIPPWL